MAEPRTAAGRAFAHFQAAAERDGRSVPALVLLGHAAVTSGRSMSALDAIDTVPRRDPESKDARYIRAYLELDESRIEDAERTADGILSDDRKAAIAYYLRGIARQRQGHARKAEKDYEKAVKMGGDDPVFHRALGALHSMQRRWRDALTAYRRVVTLTDAAPYAVYELARAQRGAGKARDAATSLETLVAEAPWHREAWLLLARVCHHDLRKQERRAAMAYRRYLELGGDDPGVADALAQIEGS